MFTYHSLNSNQPPVLPMLMVIGEIMVNQYYDNVQIIYILYLRDVILSLVVPIYLLVEVYLSHRTHLWTMAQLWEEHVIILLLKVIIYSIAFIVISYIYADYLPPIICPDYFSVRLFCPVICPIILPGYLPPIILPGYLSPIISAVICRRLFCPVILPGYLPPIILPAYLSPIILPGYLPPIILPGYCRQITVLFAPNNYPEIRWRFSLQYLSTTTR